MIKINYRNQQEKNLSQYFIEYITKRTELIDFINLKYIENNFSNNVNIIKAKNANMKLENLHKTLTDKDSLNKNLKNNINNNMDNSISTNITKEGNLFFYFTKL